MRPSTQTSSVALLSGLLRHAKWLEGIGDSEHARHVRARAMSVSYTLDQRTKSQALKARHRKQRGFQWSEPMGRLFSVDVKR